MIVDVTLPLAKHASGIGYLTIGLETFASLLDARRDHWEELGPDLQLLCRLLSTFASDDYLDGQALRQRLRVSTAELLREVDVLALPMTADEAPRVTDQDMTAGFADTPALHSACRYAFLGNLTGLPCGHRAGRERRGGPAGRPADRRRRLRRGARCSRSSPTSSASASPRSARPGSRSTRWAERAVRRAFPSGRADDSTRDRRRRDYRDTAHQKMPRRSVIRCAVASMLSTSKRTV